jgi:hypothetical protein
MGLPILRIEQLLRIEYFSFQIPLVTIFKTMQMPSIISIVLLSRPSACIIRLEAPNAMPYLPNSLTDLLGKDVYDARAIEELPESDRPRSLPLAQSLTIVDQLLQGLSAAHDQGLVHETSNRRTLC